MIGVGVEGKADICAEVVQSAGKDFGLCDHAAAGLVGAVVFALMFACAEADADYLAAKCRAANRVRGGLATR